MSPLPSHLLFAAAVCAALALLAVLTLTRQVGVRDAG